MESCKKTIDALRQSLRLFWSHTKQHSSKTMQLEQDVGISFWSHTKQHSSKTCVAMTVFCPEFWSHTKQHSSKTLSAL